MLESDAAQRAYGLRIPGKEIAPSGGAAHRFACLRALAALRRRGTAVITERVSYEQLLGISACLALALLAHLTSLPLWVPAIVVIACGLIRLGLARRGRGAPPGGVLLIARRARRSPLLFVRFHTFNGLAAGTALLALMAGLKLLETKTQRDIYIITLIIYFVSLAALLEGDSFWLLAYLIGVCWLTTATLLRLTSSGPAPDWRAQPALRRTDLGPSSAAGAGVLAAVPAIRRAAVAYPERFAASPRRA